MLSILHTKIKREIPAIGKCVVSHIDSLHHLYARRVGTRRDGPYFWDWSPNKPSAPLFFDLMFSSFQSSFSSQMPCLSCPSKLVIPFWGFYRTHHFLISYVLYFDQPLPETAIPSYTLLSAGCGSPHNLEKPLLGIVQHLENECFPGCISRAGSNAQFYLSREKRMISSKPFQLPDPRWEMSSCKSTHIAMY